MSQADDVGNLFLRFGASADSYKEINSEFEYFEPLIASVEAPVPAPPPALAKSPAATLVELKRTPALPAVSLPVQATAQPVPARLPTPAVAPSPAPAGSLRERLLAVASERRAQVQPPAAQPGTPAQRPQAQVIVVLSAKGGVGKTTVAASLGRLLKRRAGRTVLLDLDPQNALLSHFNLPRSTPGLNQARLHASTWGTHCVMTSAGIECLPFGPSNAADLRALDSLLATHPDWLAGQLADLKLGRDDLLVIDTPTGASPWLQQALAMADQVIGVTHANAASYLVLDTLQAWLSHLHPQACHYLVNKVDPQNALSVDMAELFHRHLGNQWLAAIPLDAQFDQALAFEYDPFQQPADTPACQALRAVAVNLAQRIEHNREESSAR